MILLNLNGKLLIRTTNATVVIRSFRLVERLWNADGLLYIMTEITSGVSNVLRR
jgi:hypothetical protein